MPMNKLEERQRLMRERMTRGRCRSRRERPASFDPARLVKWRRELTESNMGHPASAEFEAGMVLLAAFDMDTQEASQLSEATRLSPEFVKKCRNNLVANGVWVSGKWAIPEDVNIEDSAHMLVWFSLTVLVALGTVVCVRGDDSRHHAAKLDADKVREIRRLHAAGFSQNAIARKYGVSQPTIGQIVNGSTWRNVV